jgi:squalene-associated FAD-dependent desaturase
MGEDAARAEVAAHALGVGTVSRPTAIVIGGGLAGLAAAARLARHDWRVTILESKSRLGGRAGSFTDPTTGELIDACQHVSMGCCTQFAEFCRTVGIDHLLAPQKTLYFMTRDRRVSRFKADPLPAPLHLARSFLSAHFLTLGEKWKLARGLSRLVHEPADHDPPFLPWLQTHRQTQRTIDRFWSVVLVSALNESIERIGLKYARKVFRDAFWSDRRGFEVQIPTVPLDRLYGPELQQWLAAHHVEVRLNAPVTQFSFRARAIESATLRTNETLSADAYITAVPFDRLLSLSPSDLVDREPTFANLRNLELSPITSVHLWFDRPITELPHVVFVACVSQWLFNRGNNYVQIVVSASHQFRGVRADDIQNRILDELNAMFPNLSAAKLLRSKVVTEHAATFSPVPGVDQWRPGPVSPIENLFLAGDWTATGWPATMEGAVISGNNAAAAVLRFAPTRR